MTKGNLLPLACVVLVVSCKPELVDSHGQPSKTQEWVFVSADGITPVEGFQPQVTIRAGRFWGRLGCNQFSGRFHISNGSLRLETGMKTEIGCARPILERETQLAALFQGVNRYDLEGGSLTLHTQDRRQIRFAARVPKPNAPLEGTAWKVQSLSTPDGLVTTSRSIQNAKAVLTNGSLRIEHPCFVLTASYVRKESKLSFGKASISERPCDSPAEGSATARAVGSLLPPVDGLQITEDRLALKKGSLVLLDLRAGVP